MTGWQRYQNVGIVGDLHAGSKWAIWPHDDGGDRSALGYLQRCFSKLVHEWPELDLLILMGDLIDGTARKDAGRVVFSTSIRDQRKAAQEILRPLALKSRRILRVTGTEYHDEDATTDALAALDAALGIDEVSQVFWVDMGDGKLLNAAHHPESAAANTGTSLGKEIEQAVLAQHLRDAGEATWIARAHLHKQASFTSHGRCAFLNGCWKLQDPYAVKGRAWGWRPDLGASLLYADDRNPMGYTLAQRTFQNPRERVITEPRTRDQVYAEQTTGQAEPGRHAGPAIPKSLKPREKYV